MATKKLLLPIGIIMILLLVGLASATITSYSGLSPANANVTTDTTPDFSFTPVSDINATFSCELFINNTGYGINASVSNNTATTITANASLSDATYTWYINCTDVNGTVNSSSRTITIDTTSPGVVITSPAASSWHVSNFVINVTATANTVKYRYENSTANSSWTNLSNTTLTAWNVTFNVSAVADGNYTIRINATDDIGNSNTTVTRLLYVDDTNPSISSFTQTKTDTITVGESLTASDFRCSASDNSATFGGTVNTTITGLSTTSTGTKTATCTATDSAGNTATETVSYTVHSGISYNGGGGGTITESSSSEIRDIESGEIAKFTKFSDTGIEEVRIGVIETATSVKITTKSLSDKPSIIDVAQGEIYKYLQITVENLDEDNLASAVIKFSVEKSWFADNGASKNLIILYRWVDGEWNKLSTKLVDEDAVSAYYEAETTGFSYFAITSSKATISATEGTQAEETASSASMVNGASTINSELINKKSQYMVAILVILIGVVIYYFFMHKKTPKRKSSKLEGKYIKLKLPKKK